MDRPKRTRYTLLLAALLLGLSSFCLYAAVFSPLLHNLFLSGQPTVPQLVRYNYALGWSIGFIVLILVFSALTVILTSSEMALRRLRQTPLICPHCATLDGGATGLFRRSPVTGTGWIEIACCACRHTWYVQP